MAETGEISAFTIIAAITGLIGCAVAVLTFVWARIGSHAAWKKEVVAELRDHHDRLLHVEWMCKPLSDLTEQRLIETVKRTRARRPGGE